MADANTHAGKAASYDIGRPDYPEAFFDFLFGEIGFKAGDVVADIGCGTGKNALRFLMRGASVIAVEPDPDMLRIAVEKCGAIPGFNAVNRYAEYTGIADGSVSHIFCGNSFGWFKRTLDVPEFKRILMKNGKIVVAHLSGGENPYDDDFLAITYKYHKPAARAPYDGSPPFMPGTFSEKEFIYYIDEPFEQYLHGALSTSFMPSPGDVGYDELSGEIEKFFRKFQRGGTIEAEMVLRCQVGSADDLA